MTGAAGKLFGPLAATKTFALIGAILVIATIVVFQFLTDPGISGFMKFIISAFYLGWAALFVSVLRQRLIERKTDKYKDVEI